MEKQVQEWLDRISGQSSGFEFRVVDGTPIQPLSRGCHRRAISGLRPSLRLRRSLSAIAASYFWACERNF